MKVVGAALKKIAVALVSNPQNWRTIVGIILALIIVVVTPVAVIVAILNGNIEIDQGRLAQIIQQNITVEQSANLEIINTTMEKVEQELENDWRHYSCVDNCCDNTGCRDSGNSERQH